MAPLVAPEVYEKVHRHQHQFPEKIKNKKVHCKENTVYAGKHQHQLQVKKTGPILNLRPRSSHRCHAEKGAEHHQQKAQTIHGQMETYAHLGNPFIIKLNQPYSVPISAAEADNSRTLHANSKRKPKGQEKCDKSYPAREHGIKAFGQPCSHTANNRDKNKPYKYHKNTTNPRIATAPIAIPAAYQRSFPDWVSARSRLAPLLVHITPR